MIVYKITNRVTGAAYIGVTTKTLGVRYSNHWTRARGKAGRLSALHRDMRRFGEDAFTVEAVASALDVRGLFEAEVLLIETHRTHWRDGGYNLTRGGDGASTGPQDPDLVRRRADALRGKTRTAEQKARISAALKGRPKSETHRASLSAAKMGHKRSAESVEKSAIAHRGKKQSEETIRRRSETMKRKNRENHVLNSGL